MTDAELLREYRDALAAWGAARQAMESRKDARAANRFHDKQRRLYESLRESAVGREGIVALMDDPDPWVQVSAAHRSLAWQPERAEGLLDVLAKDESLPAALTFNAEMVLDEWRAGKLNPEY